MKGLILNYKNKRTFALSEEGISTEAVILDFRGHSGMRENLAILNPFYIWRLKHCALGSSEL
jgi:hypothetical protein